VNPLLLAGKAVIVTNWHASGGKGGRI